MQLIHFCNLKYIILFENVINHFLTTKSLIILIRSHNIINVDDINTMHHYCRI
jgi:hypothetical protein